MKYLDEFRNPQLIAKAVDEICRLADPQRQYRLMEVCGGHTHAIYRFGLKDLSSLCSSYGTHRRWVGYRCAA